MTVEEGHAVLGLLAMLKGARAQPAAHALGDLFDRRSLVQASEVLKRWAHYLDETGRDTRLR